MYPKTNETYEIFQFVLHFKLQYNHGIGIKH